MKNPSSTKIKIVIDFSMLVVMFLVVYCVIQYFLY